jgi:hypothetical protein
MPRLLFDAEKSILYFHVEDLVNESEKSPMAQTISRGESSRKIGSSVLSLLYDIGWTKPVPPVEITSQLSENSTVRMNYTYQFNASLAGYMYSSSCIWSFEIMKSDGTWENFGSSSSGSINYAFTIPTITDLNFARASNGAIRSRVKLNVSDQNNKVHQAMFYLLLLARPETPVIRIKEIYPYSSWSSNVVLEFLAEGADYYGITHEDIGYFMTGENVTSTGEYQEYTVEDVFDDGEHYFRIRAINQYGSSTAQLYFNPYDYSYNSISMNVGNNQ